MLIKHQVIHIFHILEFNKHVLIEGQRYDTETYCNYYNLRIEMFLACSLKQLRFSILFQNSQRDFFLFQTFLPKFPENDNEEKRDTLR